MANPSDVEARLTALEGSAWRRWPPTPLPPGAWRPPVTATWPTSSEDRRDRAAINALGVRTAGRFDQLDQRVDRLEGEMRTGFAEMRGKLDQAAAGQQRIVELRTGLIPGRATSSRRRDRLAERWACATSPACRSGRHAACRVGGDPAGSAVLD